MEKVAHEDIVAILRDSPIFSVLPEEQIEAISQLAKILVFSPNELILKERELSTYFYSILEGQVEVHSQKGGEPRRLGRGEFFGETTLIANLTRSPNVLALRKTRCLVLEGSELRSYPRVVLKLLEESSKQEIRTVGSAATPVSNPTEPSEVTIEFDSPKAKAVFDQVVKSFIEDYMVDRMNLDQSGWRTASEIASRSKVSLREVYGRNGKHGPAISELVSRGLVETRVFKGQRGRGGEIIRVRVAYDKEPVKRLVDRAVLRLKGET
jgi:hypothetical protein